MLKAIMKQNPTLSYFGIEGGMELLDFILDHCPHASTVILEMNEDYNLASMTRKILRNPNSTIMLNSDYYYVFYNNDKGKREMLIDSYPDTNNDLHTFVAATTYLTSFTCEGNTRFTDSMTTWLISKSGPTLEEFACCPDYASVHSIRRVLRECPKLRRFKLERTLGNLMSDIDIDTVFHDLPGHLRLLILVLDAKKLQTVSVALAAFPYLEGCYLKVAEDISEEDLEAFKTQLLQYCQGRQGEFDCRLDYSQAGAGNTLIFDGSSFKIESHDRDDDEGEEGSGDSEYTDIGSDDDNGDENSDDN